MEREESLPIAREEVRRDSPLTRTEAVEAVEDIYPGSEFLEAVEDPEQLAEDCTEVMRLVAEVVEEVEVSRERLQNIYSREEVVNLAVQADLLEQTEHLEESDTA